MGPTRGEIRKLQFYAISCDKIAGCTQCEVGPGLGVYHVVGRRPLKCKLITPRTDRLDSILCALQLRVLGGLTLEPRDKLVR